MNTVDEMLADYEICTTSTSRDDVEVAGDAPTIRKSVHALFVG